MSILGTRLKSLRRESGQTQEYIADLIGVQRVTYSAYEVGRIVPPYKTILKLADTYRVTVDYLMGQSNFKNYDITSSSTIPDVAEQLTIIADELLSDTTVINCNGKMLTNEEKKDILPFVTNCIKMMELLIDKK